MKERRFGRQRCDVESSVLTMDARTTSTAADSERVEPVPSTLWMEWSIYILQIDVPPHNFHSESNQRLRLACQIQVHGDVTVLKRTGFWGQQELIQSDLSIPTKPFGDLEYILDRKSPAAINSKVDNNDGKEKES